MYRFPLTRRVRQISWGVGLILLAAAAPFTLPSLWQSAPLVAVLTLSLDLLILPATYAFVPLYVRFAPPMLLIRYPFRTNRIDLSDLQHVEPIDLTAYTLLRAFGNGGLFAYYGHFYNRQLGGLFLYSRGQREGLLLRRAGHKPLFLGCEGYPQLQKELAAWLERRRASQASAE
jgi:hypothetical protein